MYFFFLVGSYGTTGMTKILDYRDSSDAIMFLISSSKQSAVFCEEKPSIWAAFVHFNHNEMYQRGREQISQEWSNLGKGFNFQALENLLHPDIWNRSFSSSFCEHKLLNANLLLLGLLRGIARREPSWLNVVFMYLLVKSEVLMQNALNATVWLWHSLLGLLSGKPIG